MVHTVEMTHPEGPTMTKLMTAIMLSVTLAGSLNLLAPNGMWLPLGMAILSAFGLGALLTWEAATGGPYIAPEPEEDDYR